MLDVAALRQFTKYNIFHEAHSFFFDKIKLILILHVKNSMTQLTLLTMPQSGEAIAPLPLPIPTALEYIYKFE